VIQTLAYIIYHYTSRLRSNDAVWLGRSDKVTMSSKARISDLAEVGTVVAVLKSIEFRMALPIGWRSRTPQTRFSAIRVALLKADALRRGAAKCTHDSRGAPKRPFLYGYCVARRWWKHVT